VAVVGLGYVGLPLAELLARRRRVIGYDINSRRLDDLRQGVDRTRELNGRQLQQALSVTPARGLILTAIAADLAQADVFIITVPTPIDQARRPDLTPLRQASILVGRALRIRPIDAQAAVVIYESTVYPGATEEVCIPLLMQESGLRLNSDFGVGYSPERINPGDRQRPLERIVKVTSGSTPAVAAWVDQFYGSVIRAGTYPAASLKVAEAAKVIENTQRDLNIALVNELAMIFDRIGIDTLDVLEAAGSKWNFLPFRPGLVGGHCIGVDPYYLTHKAEELGYHPQVVLSGRRINDGLARWLAQRLLRAMARNGLVIQGAPVLLLGLTFKENCPDLRNTRVLDLIHELSSWGCRITIVDPWVDRADAQARLQLTVRASLPRSRRFAVVVAAVAHDQFCGWSADRWRNLLVADGLLMDLKGVMPRELNPIRL
jgi:UDP-N-acetyl-D-galactosamine dehydrogenase